MKRYGMVVMVKPGKLEEYKKMHINVWPEIKKILYQHHIRNFSTYNKDNILFCYF